VRSKPPNVDFDEKLENLDIIKKITNLKDEDLVYLTYEDDVRCFNDLGHLHKLL